MSIYSYTFCVEAQQHDQITLATMTTYIPGRHIQQGRQVQGRILQSRPRHRVLQRIHMGQGSAAPLHPEAPRELCKPITSKSAHPATNDHKINRSSGCIIIRPLQPATTEALYNDSAICHGQRWSTFNLATNPEEDERRLYLDGYFGAWPKTSWTILSLSA